MFYLFIISELCCCKFYGFVIWQYRIWNISVLLFFENFYYLYIKLCSSIGKKMISGSVTSYGQILGGREMSHLSFKTFNFLFHSLPCFLLFLDLLATLYILFFLSMPLSSRLKLKIIIITGIVSRS